MDNTIAITIAAVALWAASYVYNIYVAIYEVKTVLAYDNIGVKLNACGKSTVGLLSIAFDVAIIILFGPIVTPLYAVKHVLLVKKRRRFQQANS